MKLHLFLSFFLPIYILSCHIKEDMIHTKEKFYVPANVFVASSDSTTKTEQSSFTSCGWIMSANRELHKG